MRARAGAAACLTGVAIIWLWVVHLGTFPGDRRAAAAALGPLRAGRDLQLISFYGDLGTEAVAAVFVAVTCLALWSALGARTALWVLLAALAVPLNDALKAWIGATPLAPDPATPNFPSGHVVYVTAFFGALAWLAWRRGQPQVAAVCALLIVTMGPVRVYGHSHLVSDVVAAYLLGTGWLLAICALLGPPGGRR